MEVHQQSAPEPSLLDEMINHSGHVEELLPAEPQAVRIVEVVEETDHSFELNTDLLEQILLNPKVADKKVAVIGVAGAYRKGKSFLLNFFLRYLTWRSKADKVMGEVELDNNQWMSPNSPLSGFSWRGGSERDTNGILIWSEPFLMKDKNGEEIAVLLMDTQGAFDSQSTVKDCATIFALSTMISSVQDIRCFLMPHPGLKVATNPNFDGKLVDIENEFQQQLGVMIPRLLDSHALVHKEINGQKMTCRELLEYFKAYMRIFKGQDLPEPKSMLMATAEANNLAAVASARAAYQKEMEEVCGGDTPYMSTNELLEQHDRCKSVAIREFRNARKMGGVEFSLQFLDRLESDLQESYESYLKVNNGKNLFKSMRTPTVLVTLMIIDYIFQEFFQLLGLNAIAGLFSSILCIVIGALGVWAYSRYSGHLREAGGYVDDAVTYVWTNFISPNANHLGPLGGAIQMGDALGSGNRTTNSTNSDNKKRN
ncbi:Protein CBG13900 [Caenorhabditis briggsae]|uniref:Protein CBG13900 n=1 Tax=Caenorhabditis briggsae TaxID=6238 RepID=A8XJ30_CAEBR|nr:Protein CBG13900 [Caenorhabditis briggsae]CAP32657.1 Protein CBG13900 [Caenorhabditis briggsae]